MPMCLVVLTLQTLKVWPKVKSSRVVSVSTIWRGAGAVPARTAPAPHQHCASDVIMTSLARSWLGAGSDLAKLCLLRLLYYSALFHTIPPHHTSTSHLPLTQPHLPLTTLSPPSYIHIVASTPNRSVASTQTGVRGSPVNAYRNKYPVNA